MWIAYLDNLAYNTDSYWHRASAISKIVFLALVIAAVIFSKNFIFIASVFILIVFLMFLSKLPVLKLSVLLIYPLFFGLVFAFSRVGEAANLPLVTILRAITAAITVLFVLTTTHYVEFFAVLSFILSAAISDIIFITYRSFFQLLDSIRNAFNISRLRGEYTLLSVSKNITLGARVLGHSLIRAYEANETTQRAMLVRGYEGRIAISKKALRLKGNDFVVFSLGVILFVISVITNV